MQAICPKCNSAYRVTQSMIDAHFGLLRCGNCSHQFNINENAHNERDEIREPFFSERVYKTEQDLGSPASLDEIELDADEVLKAHVRHLKALDSGDQPQDFAQDDHLDAVEADSLDSESAPNLQSSSSTQLRNDVDSDNQEELFEDEVTTEPRLFGSEPRLSTRESEAFEEVMDNITPDETISSLGVELTNDAKDDALFDFSGQPAVAPALSVNPESQAPIDSNSIDGDLDIGRVAPAMSTSSQFSEDQPFDHATITPLDENEIEEDVREAHSSRWFGFLMWPVFAILMLGILAVQIKANYVEAFQHDPILRPAIALFCKVAGCDVEPRRDISQLEIVVSRLDREPSPSQGLKVSVYILNRSDFIQPYPDITLTLNNRAGKAVGRRTFNPKTFIDSKAVNRLEPDKLGGIVLALSNPPSDTAGFEVALAKP